nr:dephospho-CoA kinase [Fimbriiglobus sp.]
MSPSRKPVFGLIGGIGAGKSTAAGCLAARGGFVIDCDKLGHVALEVPEVKEKLRGRWGEAVFNEDGSVNRRAVAGVVFDAPAERQWLESVVFPVIGQLADERIVAANADPAVRFSVLDAAVLLEAGWRDRCDKVLYIDAPRDLRLSRLAARSGWTPAELTAREASRGQESVRRRCCDERQHPRAVPGTDRSRLIGLDRGELIMADDPVDVKPARKPRSRPKPPA